MPKLHVTSGLPASGKTSWAVGYTKHHPKTVMFSYDDFRKMLFGTVYSDDKGEGLVRTLCRNAAKEALMKGFDVVIHNTTLTDGAKESWKQLASECRSLVEFMDFTRVGVDVCVGRDRLRQGEEHVGRAVIETMALKVGLIEFDKRPIVLVDVDGTLADHTTVRGPYDEHLVHLDKPYDVVVKWVNNLTHGIGCKHCGRSPENSLHPFHHGYEMPPDYNVIIVSGRSTKCAVSTENWLSSRITYSRLFMRNRGDRRPDIEVKKEILDAILQKVPKEQIAFVIDDRPCVIRMWRENGLKVYPVRGAVEEF
jgi:predicted kinase